MKNSLTSLFILFLFTFFFTSCSEQIRISNNNLPETAVTKLATSELETFFSQAVEKENVGTKYSFTFHVDTAMQKGEFSYKEVKDSEFLLQGGDPTGVLHAVYSLLEEIGYTFDITGTTAPDKFNFEALKGIDKTITPKVRWRGIRQHVNFPMDISSYPVDEAKEYIRNLARLRFNKLVIHSYPGQWYEWESGDSINYAGHFFYGDRHYMYDNALLRNVVRFNDSTFCIPDAEKCYDNIPERSKLAIEWMSELMNSAKECGMLLQFSFEPRAMNADETVKLAHKIVDTYPQIDALEMITEETGGWGPQCTEAEVKETLKKYFPETVMNDSAIINPIKPKQTDLNQLYSQIGVIGKAIETLNNDSDFQKKISELKMGIYCTMPAYEVASYRLAQSVLPDNHISIMPSHGSDGVAKAFGNMVTTKEDLDRTEIYSWIEFDGLMYIQQNGSKGIFDLEKKIDNLLGENGQCYSLLFNHWRTAENRASARFAAISTLYGTKSMDAFYGEYADRLGIKNKELFAKAMNKINEVDTYATVDLVNIAFCWMGGWNNGGPFDYVDMENIDKGVAMYLEAGNMLGTLLSETEGMRAKEYLAFLGNRTLASVIYLKAFKEVGQLHSIKKGANGQYSEEDKQKAIEICNHALLSFDQFMETYAQQLPDRGSEGTLVSVWNAPIRGLKLMRSRMGGVPMDEYPHSSQPIDAPPLPIFFDAN